MSDPGQFVQDVYSAVFLLLIAVILWAFADYAWCERKTAEEPKAEEKK